MYAAKRANTHHCRAYAALRQESPPPTSGGGGTRCTAGDASDVTSGCSAVAKTKALYSVPGQRLTRRDRSRTAICPAGSLGAARAVSPVGDSPCAKVPDRLISVVAGTSACLGSVTNPRTTAIRAPLDRTTNGVTTQYPGAPRSRRGVTRTCPDPSYLPLVVIRRPVPPPGPGVDPDLGGSARRTWPARPAP